MLHLFCKHLCAVSDKLHGPRPPPEGGTGKPLLNAFIWKTSGGGASLYVNIHSLAHDDDDHYLCKPD